MKISVIVPAHNYARYLPDLFQSLLVQTVANWECLLVDNGSSDETEKVCSEMAKADNRFVYIKTNLCYPAAARNIGLQNATGKFIQFLDADDIIDKKKFEIQLKLLSTDENLDIVYGDYLLTDEKLENHLQHQKNLHLSGLPFNDFVKQWEKKLTIPIHSYLIRSVCFQKWGVLDETIRTHEDWDLQLNFSLKGARYKYHNDVVAFYRIHGASSSRNDRTVNRRDTLDVLMKYYHFKITTAKQKLILLMRYIDFVGDILLDKVRYNNVKIIAAIRFFKRPVLNCLSLLLFPCYLINKITSKLFAR